MRILTAGESHGEYITAILEGFPKGIKIEQSYINYELKRRMSGFGRGKRMNIEDDTAKIVSGLRNKISLGSPISILVKNNDARIFSQKGDSLAPLVIPRPAHADLSGAIKYQDKDVRNILERSSARESVARVCAGAVCKQLLSNFGIKIASFTVSVGSISCEKKPKSVSEIVNKTKKSKLNCLDDKVEKIMIQEIETAQKEKDALGGVIEIWIEGAPPGLGSFMHFDQRLDAIFAFKLMSIPAIKGVEIGLGFEYAYKKGSESHDSIFYSSKSKKFYHKTNNSGGIEGGISTGEPIILRLAMKPIATLQKPLDSVNLLTKKPAKAIVERSDTCAIVACGVIAESMAAIVLAESFLEKFGSDSLTELKLNHKNYLNSHVKRF